jgi:hypothetical protein
LEGFSSHYKITSSVDQFEKENQKGINILQNLKNPFFVLLAVILVPAVPVPKRYKPRIKQILAVQKIKRYSTSGTYCISLI